MHHKKDYLNAYDLSTLQCLQLFLLELTNKILFRCILKDFVFVENGARIPPDMVIPPFSIVSGSPARIVGELPVGSVTAIPNNLVERFKALKQVKTKVDSADKK